MCWAASDGRISFEELDVGLLAANKGSGTLARVPKPVGNASLLYEFAQSAHTFGVEAWRLRRASLPRGPSYVRTDQQASRGVPQAHFKFPDVISVCHSGRD